MKAAFDWRALIQLAHAFDFRIWKVVHHALDDRVLADVIDGLGVLGAAAGAQRLKPPLFRKGHDPALAGPSLHLAG